MTIPFLNYFKKVMPKTPAPVQPALVPRVEKSSSERLSKTVMPNATRTLLPQEQFEGVPPAMPMGPRRSAGVIKSDLPPAVALALEPRVERVISLELRDVVAQMPEGWTRPVSDVEGSRRVLLKAAEVEKGMSSGKPSVCLTSVYKQVPEIFVRPVEATEETQVPLPFARVLDQFGKLQTRSDQCQHPVVPQLETPFLRMTVEDNERMGIKTGQVQASVVPQVVVEPATAQTIAAAEPESFKKVAARAPAQTNPAPSSESVAETKTAPTRIPFKLSPIGTGAPASERVPASSGPSVPTNVTTPTRIPFKMAPSEDTPAAAPAKVAPNESVSRISLALKPILLTLPPGQLTGDANSVGDDVQLEVPFSLVESQLSSGRVCLSVADFEASLPEQYRNLFSAKEIDAPIILPLQDVLKNLPTASLRMRTDQEEQEKGVDFQTPFSAKAAEDAKRFGMPVEAKPLKGEPQFVDKVEPAKPAAAEAPKVDDPFAKIKMPEPVAPEAPLKVEMPKPEVAAVARKRRRRSRLPRRPQMRLQKNLLRKKRARRCKPRSIPTTNQIRKRSCRTSAKWMA